MASILADEAVQGLTEETWRDVIAAMDRTYSELVDYQSQLERQNQELDEMRRFMHSVLASVSDLLIVVDLNRSIEQTGGAISAILGTPSDPAPGTPLTDLLGQGAADALFAVMDEVVLDRMPRVVEVDFLTLDGPSPLEVSISPRLNTRGRSQGLVLVGRPLGELRNAYRELAASHAALQTAQGQLVQQEKLASLGRLVAGVAHELNNPISFVYANTHALEKYTQRFETYFDAVQTGMSRPELVALRQDLRLDKAVKNLRLAIDGAKDGAERVRDIVQDLRRLSADGSGEVVDFDLVTTARTAADWVVRGTKTPVDIRFEGVPAVMVRGNPGHVQQIVMNLVQNAVDALATADQPRIDIRVSQTGDGAVLRVADNGPGIAQSDALSVFDPFFTTKPVGQGTGLGLSISQRIATDNGGQLRLADTGPDGCAFELWLEAAQTP